MFTGDAPISSDYLAASEIKVKKPKKKKSKNARQKQHDEEDIFPLEVPQTESGAMDIDVKDSIIGKKRKADADTFVDDEDLQASLAIQRKNALKKRKKMRPEDIAKQLREQGEESKQSGDEAESGGLVIGEISEFVAGLSKPEEGDEEERKSRRRKQATRSPDVNDDHMMGEDIVEEQDIVQVSEELEDNGVEEEKVVGEGMGAALALLRERGLVEDSKGENQFESFRDRQEFISKKRRLEDELDEQTRLQRERDRASGKLDRMSVRDREDWARQQNNWREHQQSKKVAELFHSGYKPHVELKYTDEHGRQLDQKEAFKQLSHQFHGKGSGKGKTEKLMKKIEDEKRRDAQSMFDASQNAGMSKAAAQQLKKRKEAGVRLG